MKDLVNHPEHYQKPGRKECIVEMEEKFGTIAVYWFSRLSAYKYRYRKGYKLGNSAAQDEMKAKWYDNKAAEMERKSRPEMDHADKLLRKIIKSKELTALEKRYIENLLRHTRTEFTEMSDAGFMAHIIAQICDYAVANEMPPTDTVRALAENLTLLCEISDFDGWKGGQS